MNHLLEGDLLWKRLATWNSLAASKEDISPVEKRGLSVEKWGLTPPEPDVPSVLTLLAPAPSQTLLESESLSSLLLMVENSGYLQNENWLREVLEFKYYLLHAVAPDYRIKSLRDYSYSRSSCPLRGLQLF